MSTKSIHQRITVYWRVFAILLLLNFAAACTNRSVVLPYNEPPVDLQTPISSIRVNSFSVGNSKYGENFKDTLVALLAKEGVIQILTTGAESELSGQVNIGRINQTSYSESYKTEEKINDRKVQVTKNTYYSKMTFTASVTYQLKKSSQIIGSNSFETQFDETWSGDSLASAKAKAATDQQVINQSLNELAMHIVRGISSHKTAIEFRLQLGSAFSPNEGLKSGIEYYQQELYSQAESYWKQVIKNEIDPKLKAAAYFNLGVNQFREKKFEEAFNFFRKADELDPVNKEYMAAISHTESSKLNEEQVQNLKDKTSGESRLTINAKPNNSRIRIMNILEKYQPGIALASGQYKIIVDHPEYSSETKIVTINDQNLVVDVVLKKRQ